ncbi:energy-coupling factor transporter ATP-binding protein EcfA2 [Clostridiales Family XIII bacterium PM5-7]
METIKFKGLTFAYPLSEVNALKDINFAIQNSEFVVVCGKSGCGKSTLLRHMKKNMIPYGRRDGDVLYCGDSVEALEDRRNASEIGFVQQNPDNQIVTDKVWHELAFGLENLGLDQRTIKRRVAEMASYFGIQRWFHKDVSQLSGGQKQLLNLASIMAMQPKVLILDEPTSQLDPIAASEFLRTVYKINRDLGTTVIISEHRLEEVFPMADRVMVMDKGEILAYDTPERIGHVLSDDGQGGKHPMFYGLPTVMRIFQNKGDAIESPLTIREGRLRLEQLLGDKPVKQPVFVDEEKQSEKEVIKAKDVWFKYSKDSGDVLKGLSLSVKQGEWFCILGGNGVGKSTMLKAICNVIKPQQGSITVDGIKVKKENEKELFAGRLAMVPQNPQALFTEITVEEELLEGMHYMNVSDSTKVESINGMLSLMEIEHLRKANPYDLSGGEQQRLAIGKILLLKPSILLLDEPTKGLDPFFKMTLAKILGKLRDDGVTIFMVSHDIEFCAEYADQCAMFFDGEIVSVEAPRGFFSGNNFYTTTANRIARQYVPEAITCEEVEQWINTMI